MNASPAERFQEDGFYVTPEPIFNPEEIEAFRLGALDILDHRYPSGRRPMGGRNFPNLTDPVGLIQVNNVWWAGGAIRRLTLDERIGKLAAELLGANGVVLWHDQLLYKPPLNGVVRRNGNVGFHQDWTYWRVCDLPDIVTAQVALVDVTNENGCMRMVRGSNHWGCVEEYTVGQMEVDQVARNMRSPDGAEPEIIPCEMKAGCASFHHCTTLHGSGPNLTSDPRICVTVHMLADHVRYAGDRDARHVNLKICPREHGDLYRGEQHPVIYQRPG